MIKKEHLDFWIQNSYNVLLVGRHGVGKTALVKEAFDRNKLRWRYYSASTMDPWVDLVGVPKEHHSEDGSSYLELVRPREFQEDQVDALFFDEFNRAPKKVRNAVMELIQFKSINGKVFSNLRMVWAAINPDDDDTYDVEKLDPAQQDRFQIRVDVPYRPHKPYFIRQYGEPIANAAISWWNELPAEQRDTVSPRRLDYALDVISKSGDIRFVLPEASNVGKLISVLQTGPAVERLKELQAVGDQEAVRKFLADENNFTSCLTFILSNEENMHFFLPCLPNEKLSMLIGKNSKILASVVSRMSEVGQFDQIVKEIVKANVNKSLVKKLKAYLPPSQQDTQDGTKPALPYCTNGSLVIFQGVLAEARAVLSDANAGSTQQRDAYYRLEATVPHVMDTDIAKTTLECLSMYARRTNVFQIGGKKKFMPVVNHCITQICKNENIDDWKVLFNKYQRELAGILERCQQSVKLHRQLYRPEPGKQATWI